MNIYGLDFGNKKTVLSKYGINGLTVVSNEQSKRESDSYVAFQGEQRLMGFQARSQQNRNYKNTLTDLKSLLGFYNQDEQLKAIQQNFFNDGFVKEDLNNGEVSYKFEIEQPNSNETKTIILTSTQLVAMYFTYVKGLIGNDNELKPVVLSYPTSYSQSRIEHLKTSAEIAGFSVLSMISEPKALSLAYGFQRSELPDGKTQDARKVLLVDFSHSQLTASIVSFTKSSFQINSIAHDTSISGRAINWVLYSYVSELIKAKYNLDLANDGKISQRSKVKLMNSIQKAKEMLSSSPEHVMLSVDAFHNDLDLQIKISRKEYEQRISQLLGNSTNVLDRVLKRSQFQKEELHSLEIVGGSSRIPLFKSILSKWFGRKLSMTMNSSESIARGNAIAAAIESPRYLTKKYTSDDSSLYPINYTLLPKNGNENENNSENLIYKSYSLIQPFESFPSLFNKNIQIKEPTKLQIHYPQENEQTPELKDIPLSGKILGDYLVSGIVPQENDNKLNRKFEINLELNRFNKLKFNSIKMIYEEIEEIQNKQENENGNKIEIEKKKKKKKKRKENGTEKGTETETGKEQVKEQGKETEKEQEKEQVKEQVKEQEKEQEKEKVIKTKTARLPTHLNKEFKIPESKINEWKTLEKKMQKIDFEIIERLNMRNDLEEYIYKFRNILFEEFKPILTETKYNEETQSLEKIEDWIYDEGENASKEKYKSILNELKANEKKLEN